MRILNELPWLYQQCGETDKLRECLTHPEVFSGLCVELAAGNYDLLGYWRTVGDTPQQISAQYMKSVHKMVEGGCAVDELALTVMIRLWQRQLRGLA